MKKETSIMFTPYTIDTYQTFTFDQNEYLTIENAQDEHPDKDITYDSFEWTYDHAGLVKELASEWFYLMQLNILDDVILRVTKVGEPYSPREYNFSTDNCGVCFEIDEEKLRAYIEENREAYDKDHIRSCDGFIWFGDELDTMLHYYLHTKTVEDYTEEEYMNDMMENVHMFPFIEAELKENIV